jgi:type I restriction enzyme S subunit
MDRDVLLLPLSDLASEIIDRRGVTPLKLGSDFTTEGSRVISAKLIKAGRVALEADEARFVDAPTYRKWMRSPLRADDVIMTSEAPLGELAYLAQDSDWCLGQRLYAIRPNPGRCHGRYLYYALQSEPAKSDIQSRATGTTVVGIRQTELWRVLVPTPSLPEQRAIASVLGALDDKIDLNRRMCQTLEEMARALFKSWFVDFDPVRAKMEGRDPGLPKEIADLFPSRLVDSELGPIPEGWTASDFGCIAEARREGVAANQIDAATNYIGLEHMPRRSISLWEWESGDAIESNKSRFAKGDILFGKLRPYFHKVGVAPIDGVCSTDIIVIQPKNRAAFGAVLGLASSDDFVAYTDKRSAGTRMPRTNWSDMAAYPVAVPPSAVLSAHDSIIRPLAERIASAIHEVRLLQALRDTLLPKLISGEIRVPASLGSMQEVAS